MRAAIRTIALAALSLGLSGCLSDGSLGTRATSIDEGVGATQDRAILLNIVRASRDQPLYFLSISQIQSEGSTDLHLTVPQFNEGPNLIQTQRLITLSPNGSTFLDNTTNTNLTLNVFSTHDFYAGLMAPLGLDEIDLLLNQGFSRELVFYLLIDRARITTPSGKSQYIYNDPTSPTYPQFEKVIELAMETGLTTELVSRGQESADSKDKATPAPQIVAQSSGGKPPAAGARASDIQFVVKNEAEPPKRQECYDEGLATPPGIYEINRAAVLTGKPANLCVQDAQPLNGQPFVPLPGGTELVQIQPMFRSTYSIFKYLGKLVSLTDPQTRQPMLSDFGYPGETHPNGRLLTVTSKASEAGGCFTTITYAGEHYCVPQDGDGAEHAKETFEILSALVALKQSPGDLPAQQPVLIAP